ncbi:MAG TPA: FAD-binding oxidoreductase, partial [Firmicutes bacterium]|nr:FAD-binding oxidoreductase [Bacillota bacterium]
MKEELTAIVGEKYVSDDIIDLYVYGSDASIHQKNPEIVVRPGTVEEVSKILKFANEKKIPVVARGAGSGMSGNAVPMSGGIILDLKRMDKILEIKPEDLYVRVEAGVVNDELNRVLKPYGFFFAPNPASGKICTIGGMVANNASGMRAVKYGATRDAVMGLKIVLATGEILDAGTRTLIESSGYQIERLMVGSEGTLGIIVEATLRLTPLPKEKSMGVAAFNTLSGAGEAISKIMSAGIIPSFLEYMDNVAIKSVNKMLNLNLPDVEAIVVFECDGIREEIDYNIERIKKVCTEQGATGIKVSSDPKEMNEIYLGRSKLFPAMSQ